MKIFEKKRYIRKYRKKWNENNKHSVNNIQRTEYLVIFPRTCPPHQ